MSCVFMYFIYMLITGINPMQSSVMNVLLGYFTFTYLRH